MYENEAVSIFWRLWLKRHTIVSSWGGVNLKHPDFTHPCTSTLGGDDYRRMTWRLLRDAPDTARADDSKDPHPRFSRHSPEPTRGSGWRLERRKESDLGVFFHPGFVHRPPPNQFG